jgi:hypothetical protein
VAPDTSLEIVTNADASALAVPAIVLFVHQPDESDPNDSNRSSSGIDVLSSKLPVESAE